MGLNTDSHPAVLLDYYRFHNHMMATGITGGLVGRIEMN